ncbi:MAG: GNAT family N-acetyltransferase [Methanomassiliicoccus sp.]|nr:GNAT family N-acetyltransferase [Methanomassiliicoccus sp.]
MTSHDYFVLSSDQKNEWLEVTDAAERLDISYHPDYVHALECLRSNVSVFGGRGHMFVLESLGKRVVYPFMLRPLSELDQGLSGFDISSPYGYSGPALISAEGTTVQIGDAFRKAFNGYCSEKGVVTEFCRVNPYLNGCDPGNDGVFVDHGPLVHVNLLQEREFIVRNFNRNCRGAIRKAERSGATVRIADKSPTEILRFKSIYDDTMVRNQARAEYSFPEGFYRRLAAMDEASLFVVEVEDHIVSAAWFLAYGNCVQYFLSGVDETGRKIGASNLLLSGAIEHYKTKGLSLMCLGGGHGESDSLLRFKLSFSSTTSPFRSYHKVHDHEAFKEICRVAGVEENLENYFPPYRAISGQGR